MKNKIFKLTALLFFATLFTLTSCKDDADTQSAEDAARGGFMMADAFAIANDGQGGGKALNARFSGCEITPVEIENGFKITFENCDDENGLTHNGTIIFTVDGADLGNSGWAKITITFDNYTVGDEGIDGTISAVADWGSVGVSFGVGAKDLVLKYKDGSQVTYNNYDLTYVFALTTGFNFAIHGSSNGTNRAGKKFSTKSENVKLSIFSKNANGCSGTMTVTVEGEEPITIDYGSTGTCGEMEITQKGKKKQTITLF